MERRPLLENASKADSTALINQWGGKLTLFFTYIHFSHDLTVGLLVALLPFIRQDLGLDYLQSGLLVSAFAITAGFSQLLGGWLCERIGRPKAIAMGLGGVGASAVAIGFAPSFNVLLSTLIAMGIMSGFYHPSAISTLTNLSEEKRQGRVIALHLVGGNLGFAIGPVLGAVIAGNSNWHMAFTILGIWTLIAVPLVLTQLRQSKPAEKPKDISFSQEVGHKRIGIWQVFKSIAAIIIISVAIQLMTGPIMSFASLFLVDVHHLSESAGSMWVTIIRMGGLAGGLFGGWLSDKWGRQKTIFLSLALFGPVVFLLAKLPFGIALSFVFILFGWLMMMRETTTQTYLMDKTPPYLRATAIGIYFGFGQQGSSIIQPVVGDLMDTVGITSVFNWIAFISIGLSALAAIIAFRFARQASSRS